MDSATREALEKSIKHWEDNVKAETRDQASTDGLACALCDAFYNLDCVGCPVFESTEKKLCRGTPYPNASRLLGRWIGCPEDDSKRDEWRTAAQAELDFLISLRPE